jgi:hypothetical protein
LKEKGGYGIGERNLSSGDIMANDLLLLLLLFLLLLLLLLLLMMMMTEYYVEFEVLTRVVMNVVIFLDTVSCS